MRLLHNSGLIILLPKRPVLDWIMRVDPNPPVISLAELRSDPDGFLVSQRAIASEADAEKWVHRRWKMFFELFLYDWYPEESWWPKARNLKIFRQWFDIRYSSMIWDLSDESLDHEDWDAL